MTSTRSFTSAANSSIEESLGFSRSVVALGSISVVVVVVVVVIGVAAANTSINLDFVGVLQSVVVVAGNCCSCCSCSSVIAGIW